MVTNTESRQNDILLQYYILKKKATLQGVDECPTLGNSLSHTRDLTPYYYRVMDAGDVSSVST